MKVIVVSGPTATGKTDLSIEIAERFNGEIVNFDSLLLYREINIGTAKPTKEERERINHHMIDVRSISEPMNAADYSCAAIPIVERLLAAKTNVVLTGGSGFYLQALLKGMYDSPTTPDDILKKSDAWYTKEGIAPFRRLLLEIDKKSLERYHENDHYRIRRAVEHWWTTGFPMSEAREEKDSSNGKLNRATIHDWDVLHIYLDLPKEEHLKLIEKRTERMLQEGLVEEVRALLNKGFTGLEKPLQSIGYKETLDFIFGVHKSLSDTKERIIISTRQLAKSQRTWFRRDQLKETFHPLEERNNIFLRVEKHLKN